ncbi:ABC-type glycerol-3-phosphate transport system, substrate-binding protein [Lachnospiraceae bacterium C7]|nr:ABC-type glycerol-3-phosphate transport system, substrate-binding protein [Lachnospiraceae bacterium C7]
MKNKLLSIGLSVILAICSVGITGCGKTKKDEKISKVYENYVALPNEISSVAAFTTDKDNIYILGTDADKKYVGIYKTSDLGSNWEKIDKGNAQVSSRIDEAVIKPNGESYILTEKDLEDDSDEESGKILNKIIEGKEQLVTDKSVDQLKNIDNKVFFMEDGNLISEDGKKILNAEGDFSGNIDAVTIANGKFYIAQEGSIRAFNEKTHKEETDNKFVKKLNKVIGDGGVNIGLTSDANGKIKLLTQSSVYNFSQSKMESKKKLVGATINSRTTMIEDSKPFEDGLLVQTSNEKTDKLVYISNKKIMKKNNIKVYSLYQNMYLNNVVREYASKNPGTSVELEIGITEDDENTTPSDAIKKLNTELLSGNGPDVILVDGLPVKKMKKNGTLEDLTNLKSEIESKYKVFNNIVDEDSKEAYEIPTHFSFAVQAGSEKFSKADSINKIYNQFDKMSKKSKPAYITKTYCEIMKQVYKYYLSSNIENGNLKESEIHDYFKLANKLINIKKKTGAEDGELTFDMRAMKGTVYQETGCYKVNKGKVQASIEAIVASGGAVELQKLDENSKFTYNVIEENKYMPLYRMAVNKKSKNKKGAKDFIIEAINKTNQESDTLEGFPVNLDALDTYYSASTYVYDGEEQLPPLTTEQQAKYTEVMKNLKKPVTVDSSMEDIVYEQVNQLNAGKVTIDEATKNVMQKVKLYQKES